jgi:hypothetical protein
MIADRYLGSAQRALHAETRKLARSGGDRTQHVLAAMSGRAEDSGSDNAEAGNQGLEPEGQSETDQDQLAVHEKEGQEGVQVRGARPQWLITDRRAETPQQALQQRRLGELRSRTSTAKSKPCSGKLRDRNRYVQSPTNCQIETQLVQNTIIEPFQAVRDLAGAPFPFQK